MWARTMLKRLCSGWGWAFGLRTLGLQMEKKCETTGTSALPGAAWHVKPAVNGMWRW